jgi:hypothetical protein
MFAIGKVYNQTRLSCDVSLAPTKSAAMDVLMCLCLFYITARYYIQQKLLLPSSCWLAHHMLSEFPVVMIGRVVEVIKNKWKEVGPTHTIRS